MCCSYFSNTSFCCGLRLDTPPSPRNGSCGPAPPTGPAPGTNTPSTHAPGYCRGAHSPLCDTTALALAVPAPALVPQLAAAAAAAAAPTDAANAAAVAAVAAAAAAEAAAAAAAGTLALAPPALPAPPTNPPVGRGPFGSVAGSCSRFPSASAACSHPRGCLAACAWPGG
jgi:hypothetical protein